LLEEKLKQTVHTCVYRPHLLVFTAELKILSVLSCTCKHTHTHTV